MLALCGFGHQLDRDAVGEGQIIFSAKFQPVAHQRWQDRDGGSCQCAVQETRDLRCSLARLDDVEKLFVDRVRIEPRGEFLHHRKEVGATADLILHAV